MKYRSIVLTAVWLMISIGNYFTFIPEGSVRPVEFISISVIGAFFGSLVVQIVNAFREKSK